MGAEVSSALNLFNEGDWIRGRWPFLLDLYMKYPGMRSELKANLFALSNVDYQRRVWVAGQTYGTVLHDEFAYAIHFLYDDAQLADDAVSAIGLILKDMNEVRLVEELIDQVERVLKKYGTGLTDAEYINVPEWPDVVRVACIAFECVVD